MWLLEQNTRDALESAQRSGSYPTADQQIEYEASIGAGSEDGPHILTIAGDVAQIQIAGAMTKAPSYFARLFGGGNTTYSDIVKSVALAEQDPTVNRIVLSVDSPGGQFDGLFDALDALKSAKKPIEASVTGLAASAAYAIVSQADTIVATNRAVRFGSVGVVVTFGVYDDEVTITSTEAPKKRPDVKTEAGVSMVREELDAMHTLFVDAIAGGRGVSASDVNANFGQGATLLADEAAKRGMIDSVSSSSTNLTTASGGNNSTTASGVELESKMDLKTLKTSYPDVYEAAVKIGTDEERDRVSAHLKMAESTGAMATATAAISSGAGMTQSLIADYMSAGLAKRDLDNGQSDEAHADSGTAPEAKTDADRDEKIADDIFATAAEMCGLDVED